MDIRRVVLFGLLALVGYYLWMDWQKDYPQASPKAVQVATPTTDQLMPASLSSGDGASFAVASDGPIHPEIKPVDVTKSIHVQTDVLDLLIDLKHGDIISAQLLDYPVSVDEKDTPFTLLQNTDGERYVANSHLFQVKGQVLEKIDNDYQSDKPQYQLASGQNQLVVTLNTKNDDGLTIKKVFVFNKGSYLIDVRYELKNEGSTAFKGYMNTQLLRSSPTEDKSSMFHVGSFTGASYSNPGKNRYKKISFSDMTKSKLDIDADGGWIAMQQHYFLSAWVPAADSKNRFYTSSSDGDFVIGAVSRPIVLNPEQHQDIGARLYVGPEITSVLKAIAPGLDLTVDYGFLWFLSGLLFSLMKIIYSVVGNWGWSIVLVTVLIKLAFYRLSATSYKSMAAMRKLQPKLLALRERYGDDKAKISQATMELYRQEKVNPLGGCLPIVIQIPVFIALYWVLLESVELRQAPFMLWIKDLAMADPYHILPVIMGATMLIQQKLNPAPPDPMQAKIMMFLPVFFTAIFWSFPAGLVLYWIVNNSLSILQQWYITRKYSEDKPKGKWAVAK